MTIIMKINTDVNDDKIRIDKKNDIVKSKV